MFNPDWVILQAIQKYFYNVPYLICQLTVCQGLTINLHGFNWNVIQLAAKLRRLSIFNTYFKCSGKNVCAYWARKSYKYDNVILLKKRTHTGFLLYFNSEWMTTKSMGYVIIYMFDWKPLISLNYKNNVLYHNNHSSPNLKFFPRSFLRPN